MKSDKLKFVGREVMMMDTQDDAMNQHENSENKPARRQAAPSDFEVKPPPPERQSSP